MDFARKQLEKYGWSDGKGLGKNENGISKALKPKLKRSVTGVGHDAATDFTEHWWKTLYDKAASNVEVEYKNGETKKIKTKDSAEFEITNSNWRLKRKKQETKLEEQYTDYFVKKAILTSGGAKTEKVKESESESEDEEIDAKNVNEMSDEQLFAACGGRTAHKGARHGLKALGKLARIEQQEKMLLNQAKYKGYSQSKKSKDKIISEQAMTEDCISNDDNGAKTKKKKKKKQFNVENEDDLQEVDGKAACEESVPKKKKKRKLSVNVEGDEKEVSTNEVLSQQDDEQQPKLLKKSKKKKNKIQRESEEVESY